MPSSTPSSANADAHATNLSLLHRDGVIVLAPLLDNPWLQPTRTSLIEIVMATLTYFISILFLCPKAIAT